MMIKKYLFVLVALGLGVGSVSALESPPVSDKKGRPKVSLASYSTQPQKKLSLRQRARCRFIMIRSDKGRKCANPQFYARAEKACGFGHVPAACVAAYKVGIEGFQALQKKTRDAQKNHKDLQARAKRTDPEQRRLHNREQDEY